MGIPQYNEPSEHIPQTDSAELLVQRFGRLSVLDDLIRLRATDVDQVPILAYPKPSQDGYECFTGEDLDCMVDQAVCALMELGIRPATKNEEIVALFTPSDLNMVVTFFALSRIGYTIMMLSPRLSAAACVSLLDKVGCDTLLYGQTASIRATVGEILRLKLVTCRPIIQRPSLEESLDGPSVIVLRRSRNREQQRHRIALILHSSGSTGTPKPLFLSHKALMTHPLRGPGLTSFNSLPWYHLHGLSTALQAMYMRKVAFMWDAALPLTASSVVTALEAAQPESVQGVPYLLQLLVDSVRGLDVLRQCRLVTYGGAPCPDGLGDKLVAEGVRFGGSFGLTEAGLVAESISRPAGDPYWNYLRFFDNIRPYIWMKPIGQDLYEAVYLSGHPALTSSNSDEPPGSYHSRDVFSPHPSIADRWKYISRLDDRITLMNGEKVLPLPIEGSIKQSPFIEEAVVVGVDRAVPGLLVFRSEGAQIFSDEEYLNLIWPTVEDANLRAEQFSQIAREMICVLPYGSARPQTDKGSMIRAQVYIRYANEIEDLYTRVEQKADGTLKADLTTTEAHLMRLCRDELRLTIPDSKSEFFALGIDSLKAIHLRRLVLRDFKLADSKSLGQNVVFETGNISALAAHIGAIQDGQIIEEQDQARVMQDLITKHSSFRVHKPVSETRKTRRGVILTGATGSMGAHTLQRLLNDDTVSVVYCLTRRDNPKQAILNALAQKGLDILSYRTKKIIALKSALHEPGLGLDQPTIGEMLDSVSLIIHTAWPVNFNLPLSSFDQHIQGLSNLIDFSLSVRMPAPAVFLFCSSISTALGSPSANIEENPIGDLDSVLDMGYARSKLVGEKIVGNARRSGARAFSLRIGQVSGHSKKGLWNDSEAIPLMVRSALTLKALPDINTTCSWLPADKLACSLLEIARACSINSLDEDSTIGTADDTVYNLCNSRTFTWSELLGTLRQHGFSFETVPFNDWLKKLRESEARGEELINPAVKLADHYEEMYGGDSPPTPKIFLTDKAERDSMTLRNGRLRIVRDGILARYAQDWLKRWTAA
ncbi:NRPS-like enzyme [Aspergillus carlsbadensis]|nr:NRPS-like enzyme [Aspergillus carlsbadensis]